MKIESYKYPKSSFLSVEKDMDIIINFMLKNERLKKLLFYTSKDCLNRPNISEKESIELFGKNIRNVPKLLVDSPVRNYIIINFNNFIENVSNPEFRDNTIEFDVICHFDQWSLEGTSLRPFKIAAEIDSMFNKKHLTGIGILKFLSAKYIILNDEFAGLCLMYEAIHGGEDTKESIDPKEQQDIIANFNTLFN